MTQPELAGMPAPRPKMLEAELLDVVIETARLFGWRVAHFRPAMTKHGWRTAVAGDGKGFPDLILVRDTVLAVELKVGANTLSDEQAIWLEAFRTAGVEAFVWTDADWFAGTIEAALHTRRGYRLTYQQADGLRQTVTYRDGEIEISDPHE